MGMRAVEREAKVKRIEKILEGEPELSNHVIAKRLGCSTMMVRDVRERLGISEPDRNVFLNRSEADAAARKLGLMDTQEVSRAKWKNKVYRAYKESVRKRREGEDYTRDDTMRME